MGVRLVVPRGNGSRVSAPSTFALVRISLFPLTSTRTATLLTAALLVLPALAGCSIGSTEKVPEAEPTSSVTPDPTGTTTPEPSTTPTAPAPAEPSEGDGDGEDDDRPATAGGGICGDLDAEAVGAVLGVTVRGAALSGDGGCGFTPKDPAAPAATFVDTPYRPDPGMAGAKTDATSAVEGDPEDLPSIGDAAFVVTGTQFGGEDVQGAGAVRLGDRLVSVTLNQGDGLPAAKVRALVLGLLRLAADQGE